MRLILVSLIGLKPLRMLRLLGYPLSAACSSYSNTLHSPHPIQHFLLLYDSSREGVCELEV